MRFTVRDSRMGRPGPTTDESSEEGERERWREMQLSYIMSVYERPSHPSNIKTLFHVDSSWMIPNRLIQGL